jgi:replication-associated recombination protein RarA
MRPRNLAEVVGHAGLLGPEALLPRLIKADTFGSLLFYGPPGCGKTTLAEVIAAETQSHVVRVNAVLSGTPELREILADARRQPSRIASTRRSRICCCRTSRRASSASSAARRTIPASTSSRRC